MADEVVTQDEKKPVPMLHQFTDQEVQDQIKAYLAGKDLGSTPMYKVCDALFPGQAMTIRFERMFGLVVDPPTPKQDPTSSSSSSSSSS